MGATFSKVKTVISGETILASDRNAEFDNILDNLDPSGVDDASANNTAMDATADPNPGGTQSKATSLLGEIQRLRFIVQEMQGSGKWWTGNNIVGQAHQLSLIF